MPSQADLLQRVRDNAELSAFLAEFSEFDVNRHDHGDDPRLASGTPLAAIAGDFTGGTFYLCGEDLTGQPVLYASSEGEAGVIAKGLAEALELMIGLPYWRDCLKYSANGDPETMESAAALLQQDLLEEHPGVEAAQSRAAELSGLSREPVPTLVRRLHTTVSSAGPDFVFSDATGEYGGLFGPFDPSRNRRWQDRLG
jgi:hypothetical protein